MSLSMYGAQSRTNPSPYNYRTTARQTGNYSSMGSTSSTNSIGSRAPKTTTYTSSYSSANRLTQQRRLPEGRGPLPDKFQLNKSSENVRFVSSQSKSTTRTLNDKHNSVLYRTPSFERKTSSDSGYGSSSSVKYQHGTHSPLEGRRTKSTSNLSTMKDLSIVNNSSTKYTSSLGKVPGYARPDYTTSTLKTKTFENITQLDENDNIYLPNSTYGVRNSDTGLIRQGLTNPSLTTNYSTSNSSTLNRRGRATDYAGDSRKEMITADSESLRRSSKGSTSSSSPSTPGGRGSNDGLVGLRNLGNTCFMNSVLQCLSHSLVLTDFLLKGSYTKQINSKSSIKGKLIQAYAELIKSLWKRGNVDTAISPQAFKTQIQRFAPRFVGYNQQDAQEFLRFLLEGLHDDLNLVHDKPKYKVCEFSDSLSDSEKAEKSWKHYLERDRSFITDVFVGLLKSTLKCTECGYKSVTFDPFWDLSIPIPRKSSSSVYSSSYDSRSGVTLKDCMDLFTKEEILDGDDRPTCEKCKKKRKSTKKFTIQRFPKILVLHLKRFSGFGFRSKLQTVVEFPVDEKLNMKEFASDSSVCPSALYSLYAVSNHSGSTYGGHYTAYCKHPSSGWHCFNDSSVDSMSASRIGGSQAYILFYQRVDTTSSL